MIIAMVFMLFCTFVGGSVLAAATANGYRVKQLSHQQDFLNQRSAALLVADELKTPAGRSLSLNVYDDVNLIQKVSIGNGGVVIEDPGYTPVTIRTIKFKAPAGTQLNAFQRVLLEMTVWRYLKQSGGTPAMVQLENFVYQKADGTLETLTNTADFWFQYDPAAADPLEGTVTVSVTPIGGTALTTFDAHYTSGSNTRLYDFMVDFGADSQLKVASNAVFSNGTPVVVNRIGNINDGHSDITARITTTSLKPVIRWQQPLIEKGGADA